MISLAGRDILHSWGKFVFTGVGLGLLIGVTLTMAGVYRGMVDDGKALLDNSGADLWVVQKDTLGPYAESSSLYDDVYRGIQGMSGVARAANVTYLTMQVAPGVLLESLDPMVGPVALARRAETLARRSAHNHVNPAAADHLGQRFRVKRSQVLLEGMLHRGKVVPADVSQVRFQGRNGLAVEVDRRFAMESRPKHSKRESTATTKEVNECRFRPSN